MKQLIKYLIALPALAAVSCDGSDERVEAATGKSYFPLRNAYFMTYEVSEIRYQLGEPETLSYELKAQVVDSFLTVEGEVSYVIHRSMRNTGVTDWTYLDTWSAIAGRREVVVKEENTPYLKIKSPLAVGTSWNGNTYNVNLPDEYTLTNISSPFAVAALTFPDCITIVQSDNDDYIVFLDQRKEVFARDVGLVYKETTQLQYCTSTDQGCLGKQIIESGVIYKQSITGHGVE